jgi:hypothetical protein
VLGVAGALWLAPSASADTATIGAAAPSTGALFGGAPDFAVIQKTADPTSPSFIVPPVPIGAGPWSVTSWGALGGFGDGSASLEIWRPTSTAGEFQLIVIGPRQPFPTAVLTNHPVNVPVLPGDHLGVLSGPGSGFSPSYSSGLIGDEAIWPNGTPPSPVVGQTVGASSSDFPTHGGALDARANVAAVLSSAPAGSTAAPTTTAAATAKKCKKKKHKRSAQSSKKKKCKKHKK